ncbi:MAG: hypothetical protein M3Q39_16800 [Actinomycetota bacterium]|nr:hypothetical protein [Actinomycetota bacterium]
MADQLPWCKVDSDLDSNPKIRKGGRLAREVYSFALRRHGAAGDGQGVVPRNQLDPEYIADMLMMPAADAEEGLRRCFEVALLAVINPVDGVVTLDRDGALSTEPVAIVGWSEEWGRRPRTTKERKADSRARKKSLASDDVTLGHVKRDQSVTGHACHAVEEIRGESDLRDQTRARGSAQLDELSSRLDALRNRRAIATGESPGRALPSSRLELLEAVEESAATAVEIDLAFQLLENANLPPSGITAAALRRMLVVQPSTRAAPRRRGEVVSIVAGLEASQ